MVDDAEFSDEEMAKLGLSLDEDPNKKRAPPPPSAFEPTEDAFNEPRGPVGKPAPDADQFKQLAKKAQKDKVTGGIGSKIFSLLVIGALGYGGLFGWVKLQVSKIEAEVKQVRKDFAEELTAKGATGTNAGAVKNAVMSLVRAKSFKIQREEIVPYHEAINLKFRQTNAAEACDAEQDPEVWAEMTPEEQKLFDTKVSSCEVREVVGFRFEREVKVAFVKMTAKGAAFTVTRDYSEEDKGPE